jgi:pseudaminic acid synthase
MKTFSILGRKIGDECPCYIIAELSANHGQSFEKALDLVHAAKQAGADAVKLQTYTPDTMTIDCRRNEFLIGKGTLWEGKNLHDLYAEAYTPWEWQPKLKKEAERLGMHCFSTPFDHTAVDFLERMKVPAHKIASFELVDTELLRKVASTGKPVIISTGMATFQEISEAVQTLREAGCTKLALLKCTSAYPSMPEDMNLRTIPHLAEAFGVPVGLSDHTMGTEVPVTAVALGACIIEKHLTLRRSDGGPDGAFSLEPEEFRAMVTAVQTAEKALGKVVYDITDKERASRVFRRSLFVVQDMKAGDAFTRENVRSIRPAYGLPIRYLEHVLACAASTDLKRGAPLKLENLMHHGRIKDIDRMYKKE